ncbi:NADP-dependent oxidoreductase [Priestia endophytica]|jgi:NADPH:quinone reductase-like Zn-dependent oxidoreductase|uniref:NADPH:quinone reductase n=1 Tax=Priestia endophytica DSM 13796 TaxID=1121089 RepID=A0A1I6BIH0_9BACI|nr:NADP-dependent oxidoreductase [Priestia endophytica]KYG25709.1 alcohol dehydrogenase [Priestia endophytica]SFQ80722.1 NADPH:quinone reductase [Priestia endophytica DSM 13796]
MKAAAISASGPPNVLKVMEFDNPHAGAGQVRVRIRAAGIQPFDLEVRSSGWAPPGLEVRYPQILGNEFAGIIDQVGDKVTDFSVGSEVLGWALLACYAEYVVVSVDQIVHKPQNMPWEEAGAITASGQTAHTALQELGVDKGDTILIHAAAGGVGTFAVQLAQAWGATVIGTASERNHDYLRSLGAFPVTYGDDLVDRVRSLAPNGVNVAFDAAGDHALHASLELVENKDRIGTIVAFDLAEELGVRPIRSQRSVDRLAELVELYSQGKLQIYIRKAFPLHQAADAHREIESGHGRGKVVLTIG